MINKTTRWHHHSYNNCHRHHHPQPWSPATKIITKSQTQTHNLITINHQQLEKEKEKQPSKITTKSQTHNLITTNNRKRKKKNNHRERAKAHQLDDPCRSETHADLPSTPMPSLVRDPWTQTHKPRATKSNHPAVKLFLHINSNTPNAKWISCLVAFGLWSLIDEP